MSQVRSNGGWPELRVNARERLGVVQHDTTSAPPQEPSATSELTEEASLAELTARLVELERAAEDDRRNVADATRTARWLNVRVLTLEHALRASEEESEALEERLSYYAEAIHEQELRLSTRLAQIEQDLIAQRDDTSRSSREISALREARIEASEKLEELAYSLVVATGQAEQLALSSRTTAEARFAEMQQELVAVGDTSAADELAIRLAEIESVVEEELARFAEELSEAAEEAGEVRVLAEKATDKAGYAADTADALQAELEAEAKKLAHKIAQRAKREDIDDAVDVLRREFESEAEILSAKLKAMTADIATARSEVSAQADSVEAAVENALKDRRAESNDTDMSDADARVASMREQLEGEMEELRRSLDEKAPKSVVADFDDVLGRIRGRLDEVAADQASESTDSRRRKWEAHLDRRTMFGSQRALPQGDTSPAES